LGACDIGASRCAAGGAAQKVEACPQLPQMATDRRSPPERRKAW
jgi:hypothetical protein